jgi:hypothetical protein
MIFKRNQIISNDFPCNVHRVGDGENCFIADVSAPDVATCEVCQNAGYKPEDDWPDTIEFTPNSAT